MSKLGKWGDPTVWPTETLSGRPFHFPNDWPAHTLGVDNDGHFVVLDFGLKATDFDIEGAVLDVLERVIDAMEVKPKKAVKVEPQESETPGE